MASRMPLLLRLCVPVWQILLVLAGGLDHAPAFTNVVADRFLNVDVLAVLHGPDCGQGVPVVRRGDGHDVDVPCPRRLCGCLARTSGHWPCAFSTCFMARPMTARSASQIVVMMQLLRLAKPWTWAMPRPLTPTTATRRVSLGLPLRRASAARAGADGIESPLPASNAERAVESRRKSRRLREPMNNVLGRWVSRGGTQAED